MNYQRTFERTDATIIAILVIVSMAVRLVFFNGPFGSDDLVYLERAVQISEGIWTSADYNGALRYGFNIPAGFLIFLFGKSSFVANLWPLICSIAEVVAVYLFGQVLWGQRVALYSAMILAFLPLHVAVATHIHADPIVSFFLTSSFILFYFAERNQVRWLYFLAGIVMGWVFWVKEYAVITLFPFVLYPFLWRKVNLKWAYVIGGGLFMLLAHLALMTFISGDPFHLFRVISHQVNRDVIEKGAGNLSVWYYFKYLLFDIKHTWLAGILAFFGILSIAADKWRARLLPDGTLYVVFWLLSLIFFLSFFPISLSPLRFAMKQSNYISLFLAPLALLSGYFLCRLRKPIGISLFLVTLIGGFFLSGLEQQDYRLFTSNSKAAVEFEVSHPDALFYGTQSNSNIAMEYSILDSNPDIANRFRLLGDMADSTKISATNSRTTYVILDAETMSWGGNSTLMKKAPECWKPIETLQPAGLGAGKYVLEILRTGARTLLPESLWERFSRSFDKLMRPAPATVYQIELENLWCTKTTDGQNSVRS